MITADREKDSQSEGVLEGRLRAVALHFQGVLAKDRGNAGALVGMSLVAMASRQTDAAVTMARAAVACAPGLPAAWVTLGQAFKGAGRTPESEAAYRTALSFDGACSPAYTGLGELLVATGRPDDAIDAYRKALRHNPMQVAALLGMGHGLACLERYEDAIGQYERALRCSPGLAEAEFAAGFSLARLGRMDEAERRYRSAVRLRPDFAAAWSNLGALLREKGLDVYAEAALRRAVELRPDMVSGWINLALLERDRRAPERVRKCLLQAFAADPDSVETMVAWCQYCASGKDLAGAWGWLRWALARAPDHAEAVNMRGILLHGEGRFAEAVAWFERAEDLGCRHAASNRGNSLLEMGRLAEALTAHTAASVSDPAAGARYNLGLTQLRMGVWPAGWHSYEARWRFREVHRVPRTFAQPRWKGEEATGKRILLHAEQGLGDTIQFCRWVDLVAARGLTPVLQVQKPAARLLHTLSTVRSGRTEIVALGAKPPQFDLECPLMSLPAVFETTVAAVPWNGSYLSAEQGLIARRRKEIGARRDTLRIGIAWAGNPGYKADRQRSTRLEALLPLLRTGSVEWFSLQKGAAAAQIQTLPHGVHVRDGSGADRCLADAAALISLLDLVITTDTCVAHLAGAMGKRVWILLPHLADWRWMQEETSTAWYPSARLFRQERPGEWDEVVERVSAELDRQARTGLLRPRFRREPAA